MTIDTTRDTASEPLSCQAGTKDASEDLASHAPVTVPNSKSSDHAEIGRLAAMSQLDYWRERAAVAKKLGVPTTMLDKIVGASRWR